MNRYFLSIIPCLLIGFPFQANSKNLLIEGINIIDGKILPKEKKKETKGEFNFKVGIQTAAHNYGSAAGFGKSNDLKFNFTQASDFQLEASYIKNAYGAYATYRSDIEDPSLTLNAKEIFDDKHGSENFNLGAFYMYKDKAGVFFENEINNTSAEVVPSLDITYQAKTLKKGNKYNFNISTKVNRIGISNFAEKRPGSYNGITVGFVKNTTSLPVYNSSTKKITDSKYDGLGIFFRMKTGYHSKGVNKYTSKFSLISTSFDAQVSKGKISLDTGNKTLNEMKLNSEMEFYLNKHATFSYVQGNHGLVKTNGWSDLGGALAIGVTGYLGYALYYDKDSLEYNGLNDIIPFKSAAGQIAVGVVQGLVTNLITEKLMNYEDKAYLNDNFYGIKLNYEF